MSSVHPAALEPIPSNALSAVQSMAPLIFRTVRTSVLWALAVIAFDALDGSFLLSLLACPLWLLTSLARSIWLKPGLAVASVRAAVPIAVLAVALVNDSVQRRLAMGRAEQLVIAIREYRDEHGRYPSDLQQLVPKHLPCVPRPKYAITFNTFFYTSGRSEGHPGLWWIDVPPHGKRSYNFDEARWSFIDEAKEGGGRVAQ